MGSNYSVVNLKRGRERGERGREARREREGESDSGGYLLSSTGNSYGSKYALGIFYGSKYSPPSICYHISECLLAVANTYCE